MAELSIHVVIRLLAESDFKIVSQLIFQFNFQQFHKEMDNKDCPNLFCVTFPCRRAVIRGFVSLQFYSSENLTHIHFQSRVARGVYIRKQVQKRNFSPPRNLDLTLIGMRGDTFISLSILDQILLAEFFLIGMRGDIFISLSLLDQILLAEIL